MSKKVSLRVLDDSPRPAKAKALGERRRKPSIDAARDRLGGRILRDDEPPTGLAHGLIVGVASGRGTVVPGVIIFATRGEVHVLLDGVRLRRLKPDSVRPFVGDVSFALSRISGDAHLFARLTEGENIRYAGDDGALVEAKVVEKCRWGALVARDDGAVIAVGFRKLWPMDAEGQA